MEVNLYKGVPELNIPRDSLLAFPKLKRTISLGKSAYTSTLLPVPADFRSAPVLCMFLWSPADARLISSSNVLNTKANLALDVKRISKTATLFHF